MNALIIGSGGREHALADAFARSSKIHKLVISPGNAGIALTHHCKRLDSFNEVERFCRENSIDLVFIGGEQPVADGMTDFLREKSIRVIGPSKAAGRIETSKAFAKDLMCRYSIPTAKYKQARTVDEALHTLKFLEYPLVIKADGLASGKGVYIIESEDEAKDAVLQLLKNSNEEGIIIEEFLAGWEVSLFCFCDGRNHCSTIFSQDHKQLFDNDCGPNTGGMGVLAPIPEAEPYRQEIEEKIIIPTLAAMQAEGCPFEGILYCGLMITKRGPMVLEFNCRWGDPEAEAILPLLKTDFVDICLAIADKDVSSLKLEWRDLTAVAVVLASQGYPSSPDLGHPIEIDGGIVSHTFYAGVRREATDLVNAGGRVMILTAFGRDLMQARATVYRDVQRVKFEGKYCRSDIGLRSNLL